LIKSSNNDNGIEIQQQVNLSIRTAQQLENLFTKYSFVESQDIGDSTEFTAMEKVTKLNIQLLNLLNKI